LPKNIKQSPISLRLNKLWRSKSVLPLGSAPQRNFSPYSDGFKSKNKEPTNNPTIEMPEAYPNPTKI